MKRKILLLALTFVLTFTMASCANKGTKNGTVTNKGNGEKPYIAVISKGFQHQFWQAVKRGSEQAAKDLNVTITFEGTDTESQIDKQVDMVANALNKSPQALCIAALDSKALSTVLEQAKAKGIPVIGFDSGVDSDIVVSTAATNNIVAAAAAADKMAEAIGGSGKIAMIVQDQTSTTGRERRDGFKDRIEKQYPNIKIVDIQYGGGDQLKSAEAAKSIINANPDIKGMYGANEGSAIGVVMAIEELGKQKKIKIVGFDSGKKQIDAIRSGVEYGAITQDPVYMGYKAVETAYKVYKGEKVDKVIDTGYKWYDASNVDSEEIKSLIYE